MIRFLKTRLPARGSLLLGATILAFLAMVTPACGGGGAGAGQGLALLNFTNSGVDNTVLNARLEFLFSEDVDPASVTNASIQIRQGPAYGTAVKGVFVISGSSVIFEPQLAGLCDQSDSGLKPSTNYRVQCIGFPEEFSVRNMSGQPLSGTQTYAFATLSDTESKKYDDQIPGVGPVVIGASPAEGSDAVTVTDGNKVVLDISENLDPCTVHDANVLFYVYETGGLNINAPALAPNANLSGFSADGTNTGDTTDQTPSDPYTWGAMGSVTPVTPQKVLADIELVQSFASTQITLTPQAGKFPENALIVVEMSASIRDYGNQLMTPFAVSFTTQNLPQQTSAYTVQNVGETPWDEALSTAEINTERSPGLVQGFMLFSGDGDNGADQDLPSLPETPSSGCTVARQTNDGTQDDFDPTANVVFDTGASDNTCQNSTDGSTAVVWEFRSFRIRSGITVRIIGNNPAVILVQGDVTIDSGGRLSVKSDNSGGSPRGIGQNGHAWASNSTAFALGGTGVAGAGGGGTTVKHNTTAFGTSGQSAFGSVDGRGTEGGEGSGESGIGHTSLYPGPSDGNAQGGAGGGHGGAGGDGPNTLGPNHTLQGAARGTGGPICPTSGDADRMFTPSAGAGGGAGGNDSWGASYTTYGTGGGAGGAGGGFVDLTSSGNILIMGIIDASGSKGGNGGSPYTGTNKSAGSGGGGGAGGGIRLLTPNDIILGATAIVTAAGGAGGNSFTPPTTPGAQNLGAPGGNGRVVMEDGDSVISGLGSASVTPSEGEDGFYRGQFDASRFKGGGLTPQAISELFAVGTSNPTFVAPIQADFVAGAPVGTSMGTGKTAILIEAQGYAMLPNGTPGPTGTGWHTVGQLIDSGVDSLPTWSATQPSGAQLPNGVPTDNIGTGINNIDGSGFIQLRITVYLSSSVGPFDAGPYLDSWAIRFTHDQ